MRAACARRRWRCTTAPKIARLCARMTLDDVPWDNSNSQYGLMGVWACAESGIEIPDWYWKDVEKHWTAWQLKDGQWAYKKTDRTGSLAMTAAGIASLFVTADWLD